MTETPNKEEMTYRLGVDIGGTFTDTVVVNSKGVVHVGKQLTTSQAPADAVDQSIARACQELGIDGAAISRFVHGTTLVTNALIERKGARIALFATSGFRDVIQLVREHRYDLYDLMLELPTPLVPRWLRFDVPERTLADGTIVEALDEKFVEEVTLQLVDAGVNGIAICFLHSYTDGTNERRARDAVLRIAPDMAVAISSEVAPEIREYERMSTTVANAYVQGIAEGYLLDIKARASARGISRPPMIMMSNGGLATVETATRFPIRMLESGPAAGAMAAAAYGRGAERPDLLAFDMGGTTAKLCIIDGFSPSITHSFEVDRVYRMKPGSGLPVSTPVVDMVEIGVGGGSIARIDALGLLTVGPESAGSSPGPVCYGLGGTEPTVTDADLILGYLDPHYFLGGEIELDVEAAHAAIKEQIADPLGLSVERAAYGIHSTANEDMANAARLHAVERGKSADGLPIFVYGGAGPVHGAGLARALGCRELVCPVGAGVISALGLLAAPVSFAFVRSHPSKLQTLEASVAEAIFAEMEAEGRDVLLAGGISEESIRYARSVEMRYEGQGYQVEVQLPQRFKNWQDECAYAFERAYETLYGRSGLNVPLEVLNFRLTASGPVPQIEFGRLGGKVEDGTETTKAPVYFPEFAGYRATEVHRRPDLRPGTHIEGPAIIQERESTLVVDGSSRCYVEEDGTLLMSLDKSTHALASMSGGEGTDE